MANISELKAFLGQLPTTAAYVAAHKLGDVLIDVIQEAERQAASQQWRPYVDPGAVVGDHDYGHNWQRAGDVIKRVVDNIRVQRDS